MSTVDLLQRKMELEARLAALRAQHAALNAQTPSVVLACFKRKP